MEPAEPDRMVKPFSTHLEVPDSGQKVPDGGNGNFGLEAAETLGSVPEVPEVPDLREPGASDSDKAHI